MVKVDYYQTKHHHLLEVREDASRGYRDAPLFEFLLHEEKPHGIQITHLMSACLTDGGAYFIRTYREKF